LRDCGTPQVSPDCASLHPGYGVGVACKERSGLRDCGTPQAYPDFASLHPGYVFEGTGCPITAFGHDTFNFAGLPDSASLHPGYSVV